jgi:hypothetical protein
MDTLQSFLTDPKGLYFHCPLPSKVGLGKLDSFLKNAAMVNEMDAEMEKVFLKSNKDNEFLHIRDDKQFQLICSMVGKNPSLSFKKPTLKSGLTKNMRSLLRILSDIVVELRQIDTGRFVIKNVTILKSLPGGKDQETHVDYIKRGDNRILLGMIPLLVTKNGTVSHITLNHTARDWYEKTQTNLYWHCPVELCATEVLPLIPQTMTLLWSDIPHYGVGYNEVNYRLHITWANKNQTVPSNVTFTMHHHPQWTLKSLDVYDPLLLSYQKNSEANSSILDSAKQRIDELKTKKQ